MENDNPIKKYNSKQKKTTEFLGVDDDNNSAPYNVTENEYYDSSETLDDIEVIGEETDYAQRVLKKKKRKKKMLEFVQALIGKYNESPEHKGTIINKVHFLEKLNVGKEKLREIGCYSYCICC